MKSVNIINLWKQDHSHDSFEHPKHMLKLVNKIVYQNVRKYKC